MEHIVATLRTQRYHILEKYMTMCLRALFSFLRNGQQSGHDAEITQVRISGSCLKMDWCQVSCTSRLFFGC